MPGTLTYRFDVTYAGIPLQVITLAAERGRDVVQWRPARGRGAQLGDRGQRPRVEDLTVRLTGTAEEIAEARDTLIALAESGAVRTFTHPLDGSFPARLHECNETLAAGDVTFRMTLIEDTAFALRLDQLSDDDRSTLEDVRAAQDEYDQARGELEAEAPDLAAGLPDGAQALSLAQSWADEPPTPEQQAAKRQPVRAEFSQAQERLDRARGLAAYRTGVRMLDLRGELERFGREVQRLGPRVVAVTIERPGPLIQLLSSFYGAETAGRMMSAVQRYNGVLDPLRLRVGTVLKLPVPGDDRASRP